MARGYPHPLLSATVVIAMTMLDADARATTMIALDLEELAFASDEVVVATVVSSVAERAGGTIVTRHAVRVETVVAGCAASTDELEVIAAGGELDGLGVLVEGAPRLRHGQRYLLFLRLAGDAYAVVGQAQGAFPVVESEETAALVEPAEGLPHLVRRQGDRFVSALPAVVTRTPLSRILDRVREVLDAH